MNKTKVDDHLIEMITPQVKAIEEKFSRGEGLTQTDIHTLLLKSQYNHINHLDMKLNEVTDSVIALEHKFDNKFNELEGRFELLKTEMNAKFDLLSEKVEHTIQKALNRNMMMMTAMIGFFVVLSKIIDKF